jgi:hypothetical protein
MLQINEIIEKLLRDHNTNPEQVGERLGIPSNTVRNNMKEGANPKFEFLLSLSKLFGIKDFNFWLNGTIHDPAAGCPKCKALETEIRNLREEIVDKSARIDELRRREQLALPAVRETFHRRRVPVEIDLSNCLS